MQPFARNAPSRRYMLGAIASLPTLPGLLGAPSARAQTATAGEGFSFAAVGDTRPMMDPSADGGKPELTKLFVELLGLVMPEKVAEAGGGAGCEDDLRSHYQRSCPGRDAVYEQNRGHDVEIGWRLGH